MHASSLPIVPVDHWARQIEYPPYPLCALPADGLFQLRDGEQILVPAVAVGPVLLSKVLHGHALTNAATAHLATLSSPFHPREAINDACFDALSSLSTQSNLDELLAPWIVLCMLRTPQGLVVERRRVFDKLKAFAPRWRDFSAAVRVTAVLLRHPCMVQSYLHSPSFSWKYLYTQHRLHVLLSHLPSVFLACVAASADKELKATEITAVIDSLPLVPSNIPATVVSPTPAILPLPEQPSPPPPVPQHVAQLINGDDSEAEEKDSGDGGGEYIVNRVEKVKISGRQLKFLVRWEGCGLEEDTWESWKRVRGLTETHKFLKTYVQKYADMEKRTADLGLDLRAAQRELAKLQGDGRQ
jgi:hypothetical protein